MMLLTILNFIFSKQQLATSMESTHAEASDKRVQGEGKLLHVSSKWGIIGDMQNDHVFFDAPVLYK